MIESKDIIRLIYNSVGIMTPFLLVFVAFTNSLFYGILLGILASMVLALIFGIISLYLRANIFITGLATNLFASGITVVLAFYFFGNKGVINFKNIPKLPKFSNPFFQKIPLIGDILVGHNILVYLSWLIVIIAIIIIYKTPYGFRLRGVGINPEAISSLGLNPNKYRLSAILISGFTCGLAGAFLTIDLGAFVPNISAGRGWIALVAIYLGNRNPLGIVIASVVFGFAESISNYMQGAVNVPTDFVLAFPYLVTVLAMIFYSIWRHAKEE
jgi:simple sugar transport system permease protein